jgi:hypothetical protein
VNTAHDDGGDGFRIKSTSKEEVAYWEGSQGFLFDAAWGNDPPTLYVPSEAIWAEVMPSWLSGRRAEILERLRSHSGHRLVEDIHGHYRNEPQRRRLSDPDMQ